MSAGPDGGLVAGDFPSDLGMRVLDVLLPVLLHPLAFFFDFINFLLGVGLPPNIFLEPVLHRSQYT